MLFSERTANKPVQFPLDPKVQELADKIKNGVERYFTDQGDHPPIIYTIAMEKGKPTPWGMFYLGGEFRKIFSGAMETAEEKTENWCGSFFVSEAWFSTAHRAPTMAPRLDPSKREALLIRLFLPDKRIVGWAAEIIREAEKPPRLDPWEVMGDTADPAQKMEHLNFDDAKWKGYDPDQALDNPVTEE